MKNSEKNLSEKELKLIEETEAFMEEVYSDPEVADAEPSSELRNRIFAEIRAREAVKQEAEVEKLDVEEEGAKAEKISAEEKAPNAGKLTAEEKELIRLGRIYKKRKRLQKYVVLAAVLILALVFGMTSIGGPKRVFEMMKSTLTGREQINVDSDNISRTAGMSEEEAYQKIEETLGFVPVDLDYIPNKAEFLQAEIGEEIQGANLIYGVDDEVTLIYFMRPNYRTSSFGKDIEDDFLEEFIVKNDKTIIYIRKHFVDDTEERWSVQFEYMDVLYSMTIMNTSKNEVEKIVENLYFS